MSADESRILPKTPGFLAEGSTLPTVRMGVPEHSHDDHESVVYLVKGRMRLVIDGKEFIAQAGDAWIHPKGVKHWSETLEDCLAIEIKSPPRKTWDS